MSSLVDQPLRGNDIFISKTFRKFLFPTILSLLGGSICNFTDSVIVGHVMGETGLAAMGMTTPVFFVFNTLGSLLGAGAATVACVRIGRDDMPGVNRLFSLSIFMIMAVGLAVCSAGVVLIEPILNIMGAKGEIRALAGEYCLYFLPGAWTTMLLYVPLNFFRIVGKPHIGAWMFAIMAFFNIGLSLLFMLPLKMGISGIALGTVLGTTIALLYSLRGFLAKDCPLRLVPFGRELKSLPRVLATGSPMALSNLLTVLRTLCFNRLLLTYIGVGGVTIYSMLTNVNTFALAVLSGVAQTLVPLSGVFFGERDNKSMRQVVDVAGRWGLALTAVLALVIGILWRHVCMLFGMNDASLYPAARLALSLFGLSLMPAMVSNVFQFHFMTIGQVWLANTISICRNLVLPLTCAFFFLQLSQGAVWAGFPMGELLAIPVFVVFARFYSMRTGLSPLLLLDDRLVREGTATAFSVINSVSSVVEASMRITDFCQANGLDSRQTILLSLSLEELLLAISGNAFAPNQVGSMDVRVFASDREAILRIRHGGHTFDPTRISPPTPDNPYENLGIQMIVNSVRDIKYTRTLGVNNLTILI